MFDYIKFKEYLNVYKNEFANRFEKEKFKWEAVKLFQDNWDINASNFNEMMDKSFAKVGILLTSGSYCPLSTIKTFAKRHPETVRSMFLSLFDESNDLIERIESFKNSAQELLDVNVDIKSHYQSEKTITTYLWLRYPDKYFIYVFSSISSLTKELYSDLLISKGKISDNINNSFVFFEAMNNEVKSDSELLSLFHDSLTESCYPDTNYNTLTNDVGHFIYLNKDNLLNGKNEWYPTDYSPEFSVDDWVELLNNKSIFYENSLKIVKRFKDIGGKATCIEVARKYGETAGFYNLGTSQLAKRISKATNCPLVEFEGKTTWYPILFFGKNAGNEHEGAYVWKLRDELSEAIELVDLSHIDLYETKKESKNNVNYWWLNANPSKWSFSSLDIGEEQWFTLYSSIGNKRRIFQNFLDAKVNDLVICYESNPVKKIVALAKISAEQDGKLIYIEKIENLVNLIPYEFIKSSPELNEMEFVRNPNGSLFKLTKEEFDFIYDVIRENNPIQEDVLSNPYSKADFLDEVYMSENKYDKLVTVLKNKKNIILQGAPGVGKTFAAKRLAYSMMGEKDESRIEFVQFHQNYSYEDFVMGYKPDGLEFALKEGVFHRFCTKAKNQPEKDFFFIIDEINRGNMSKIFGELLMLIEKDYRGEKVTLAYDSVNRSFTVPENLFIIGMMNTADRSLAMIDYALRRRFSFFEMDPGFLTEGFSKYTKSLKSETLDNLIIKIQDLNREISADKSLGKGFCIGHSYFCGQESCNDEWLKSVIEYEVLPMLNEYWFDEPEKVKRWENNLFGIFQ